MKSIEVEVKKSSNKGSDVGMKTKKPKRLGSLSLDENQLPTIKDWQVGEEYEIIIKVKQTGSRLVDSWDIEQYGYKEGDVKADFDILSASTKTESSENNEK
jgi:hypothetical protein